MLQLLKFFRCSLYLAWQNLACGVYHTCPTEITDWKWKLLLRECGVGSTKFYLQQQALAVWCTQKSEILRKCVLDQYMECIVLIWFPVIFLNCQIKCQENLLVRFQTAVLQHILKNNNFGLYFNTNFWKLMAWSHKHNIWHMVIAKWI
jgi:hypothetical protein